MAEIGSTADSDPERHWLCWLTASYMLLAHLDWRALFPFWNFVTIMKPMIMTKRLPLGAAFAALASTAGAQTATPLLEPKPTFVPGLYETESRNSTFQDQPVKSRTCIESADFDAFRDETMAQYQKAPQFLKDCRLSDTKSLTNGFAFAMQCKSTKTILAFHFAKDIVSSTIETIIVNAPKYSSSILTMMRRVGDCPGHAPGKPL